VGIIIFMAGETIPLQLHFVDWLDVAGGALGFSMRADQRVAGVLAVVEVNVRPAAAGMAGFTALTEVSFVVVVFTVAGDAGHIELIGERIFAVAAVAALLGVLAVEYEIRIAVVVETGVVPALRVMAVAAFIAAAAIVCVVFRMAIETFRRRALEGIVGMAVEAGGLLVLGGQGIPGGVVIEFDVQPLRR